MRFRCTDQSETMESMALDLDVVLCFETDNTFHMALPQQATCDFLMCTLAAGTTFMKTVKSQVRICSPNSIHFTHYGLRKARHKCHKVRTYNVLFAAYYPYRPSCKEPSSFILKIRPHRQIPPYLPFHLHHSFYRGHFWPWVGGECLKVHKKYSEMVSENPSSRHDCQSLYA